MTVYIASDYLSSPGAKRVFGRSIDFQALLWADRRGAGSPNGVTAFGYDLLPPRRTGSP